MPDDVTITPYRDGPLLVRGDFRIVDQDGTAIEAGRTRPTSSGSTGTRPTSSGSKGKTVALCRCGKSRLRPFCDGTHKLVRFRAPSGAESARD
jgi:CDGSH-type Zn-finger protein